MLLASSGSLPLARTRRRAFHLAATLSWLVLWHVACVLGVSAQDLPQQTGAINDYAAALGGKPQRAPLKTFIEALSTRYGIDVVLLLAQRNPFDTTERYGEAIQQAWQLPRQKRVFALFLKRKGRWSVRLWPSVDVLSTLGNDVLETLQTQTEQLTRKGRVRQAVRQMLAGILNAFEAPAKPTPELTQPWKAKPVWIGVLLVLLALWGVGRWLRSFCPNCTGRLNVTTRGKKRLRSCPRCGYNRHRGEGRGPRWTPKFHRGKSGLHRAGR